MGDEFRIVLKIAGREYPMKIDRKDEEKYRRAAKEVNELVNMYNRKYSADMENYLAMTSLQLALVSLQQSSSQNNTEIIEELKRLEEELK